MGAPESTAAGTTGPGSLPSITRLGTGENVLGAGIVRAIDFQWKEPQKHLRCAVVDRRIVVRLVTRNRLAGLFLVDQGASLGRRGGRIGGIGFRRPVRSTAVKAHIDGRGNAACPEASPALHSQQRHDFGRWARSKQSTSIEVEIEGEPLMPESESYTNQKRLAYRAVSEPQSSDTAAFSILPLHVLRSLGQSVD